MNRVFLSGPVSVHPRGCSPFTLTVSDTLALVKARKDHPCHFCPSIIKKGSQYVGIPFFREYWPKFCLSCAKSILPLKNGGEIFGSSSR